VTISGSGSVASQPPGIACGKDCTETYDPTETVTLRPHTGGNWQFDRWGGACEGQGFSCTLQVDVNKAVTATFVETTPSTPEP
jgi:Divergent InlB B-repeat domain